MCLIFIALKKHPVYKLILATNRDEFYARKTAPASWWPENPDILGGRDLEAGGTWLGMNRNGRLAMVTNFRDLKNIRANAPSRGFLVSDYLESSMPMEAYVDKISGVKNQYNGFNLLAGDTNTLSYQSNYSDGPRWLTEGIYGLSNHLLDTPWPKVANGRKMFGDIISQGEIEVKALMEFLSNEKRATDNELPDTGVGLERERALSSMFIKIDGYGTRCSTVILADYKDNVSFTERVYNTDTFKYLENNFNFHASL
jgi:uncharacterized protein with NRDE domain